MRFLDPAALLATLSRLLRRHIGHVLFLCLLGAALALLAPWLQRFIPGPERPEVSLTLAFVVKLPLEMYAFPRFLARIDAHLVDHASNPATTWVETFEARWFRTFLTKVFLYLIVGAGLALLIVPGLLMAIVFGWAPLRVLLRGESIPEAFRSSARIMGQTWTKALPLIGVLLGIYLLAALGLGLALNVMLPEPTLHQRLAHPAFWAAQAIGTGLDLSLSLGWMLIHQSAESDSEPASR